MVEVEFTIQTGLIYAQHLLLLIVTGELDAHDDGVDVRRFNCNVVCETHIVPLSRFFRIYHRQFYPLPAMPRW